MKKNVEQAKKIIDKQLIRLDIFNQYLRGQNGQRDLKIGERFPRLFLSKFDRNRFSILIETGFYKEVVLKDETSGEIWDCYQFVVKKFKIPYEDAVFKILEDFKLEINLTDNAQNIIQSEEKQIATNDNSDGLEYIKNEQQISPKDIVEEIFKCEKEFAPISHKLILEQILDKLERIDFREKARIDDPNKKLSRKHFLIIVVEEVLGKSKANNIAICRNMDYFYLYNGAYWKLINRDDLIMFLSQAAQKLGVDEFEAKYFGFKEHLEKQFYSSAYLPTPEPVDKSVLINLKNGTYAINSTQQILRPPRKEDFLKYQLKFEYNPSAKAPMFQAYLDKVLPQRELQMIVAEYFGYIFTSNGVLKLEKVLFLFGPGANGKSVLHDIIYALLGPDNICSFSLENLTKPDSPYRSMLANKLLNYCTELSTKIEKSVLKQLASGEPIEARLLYSNPKIITDYAKLVFNVNKLPKDVEQTEAFFRRFLIVPFKVVITDQEKDVNLAKKIIENELSGVFNWVLDGLNRLLKQQDFTHCELVKQEIEDYKLKSNSVRLFLQEEFYIKSSKDMMPLQGLHKAYKDYCADGGYHPCSLNTFSETLRGLSYVIERKNIGNVVYIKQEESYQAESFLNV
jgi:putative DNA primase/helicase